MEFAFNQPSSNPTEPPSNSHSPTPSEQTISDHFEIVTSETYTMSDLLNTSALTSEPIPHEDISSEPQPTATNLQMVVYEKPFPKTIAENLDMFSNKVLKKMTKLQAETRKSTKPQETKSSWETSKRWLESEVAKLYSFYEASQDAAVQTAEVNKEEEERINQFKEFTVRLKQAEAKAAEKGRLLAEEKARRAEEARLAKEAEAAEKAKQAALVMPSSESVHERIEQTLAEMRKEHEELRKNQNLFSERLAAQEDHSMSIKGLLQQLLEKFSSNTPSTSKN